MPSSQEPFGYLKQLKTRELSSLHDVEIRLEELVDVAPEVTKFHEEKLRAIEEVLARRDAGDHGMTGG